MVDDLLYNSTFFRAAYFLLRDEFGVWSMTFDD